MRLKALLLVGILSALPALGQGTLTFLNTATGTGVTGGSPVTDGVGGARLAGTGFWTQLYSSATQTGTYTAIGTPVNFRTGAAAGFVNVSTVAVPGGTPGTSVWIQMRAWEGAAGSSYESIVAGGVGKAGMSAAIQVGPLGGPDPAGGPAFTAPNLTGLQGFAIIPVPEPSTIALGLLGAAGLLIRRRK